MKTKHSLCKCGSGNVKEACCEKGPQMRLISHSLKDCDERQDFLTKLHISTQFNMRYRGLFEFYGEDLIAYKQRRFSDKERNDFLRVFSQYMTNHLEDNLPSSWQQCDPSFWEELITAYLPLRMTVSPQEKEVEKFLFQLKLFVYWLDTRRKTNISPLVKNYINLHIRELIACEKLLNQLMVDKFPRIFHNDFDPIQDIKKQTVVMKECENILTSVFQVASTIEDVTVLTDVQTDKSFYVKGLPISKLVPGVLIDGVIGKKPKEKFWQWHHTEGVYPQVAIKYFLFVN